MKQTVQENGGTERAGGNAAIGRLVNVVKAYPMGHRQYIALRGVNLALYRGGFTAIVGPSGSGKSTILNMVTGIDRPTSGEVFMAGRPIHTLGENELAHWRGANVGIVFQFFQLLPTLTALENVMLPMDFLNAYGGKRQQRASDLLARVGLGGRGDHLPSELSGGEQRVGHRACYR